MKKIILTSLFLSVFSFADECDRYLSKFSEYSNKAEKLMQEKYKRHEISESYSALALTYAKKYEFCTKYIGDKKADKYFIIEDKKTDKYFIKE